jgi:hypothetical protein
MNWPLRSGMPLSRLSSSLLVAIRLAPWRRCTQGIWTNPDRAKIKLADYAEVWIAQRPGLRPRTIEIYRGLLGGHVAPYIGNVPLGTVDTPMIRDWRTRLLHQGVSVSEAAQAYRFLRAVLMTAACGDALTPLITAKRFPRQRSGRA